VLVVDANVVAYFLVEGDKRAEARELRTRDQEWYAPRLLFYELASAFSFFVKRKIMTFEAALDGLESGLGLVHLFDQEPPGLRVLAIASRLNLSGYDASYVAAAEAWGVPLVTEDARILRAAPQIARSIGSLLDT
jgi:predicted nucleic acid-binding protein